MGIYNNIIENVVLPTTDVVLGRSIARHFRFLQRSQWWKRDQLLAYQESRLRLLVTRAYDRIPFYRTLYDKAGVHPSDIRHLDDLEKFPIVTKQMLRAAYPSGVVDQSARPRDWIKHASSGSTGRPFTYAVSRDAYSFNVACNLRGWYWMGFRLGDRFLKVSQYDRSLSKRLQDRALRMRYVSSADLSRGALAAMTALFRSYQPSVIRCYPDPLHFIARYMADEGITDIRPNAVTTTGSMLLPHVRRSVEERFGCPVFDSYRCEGGANAFESESHDCYISSMEYGISEILDGTGRPVGPGGQGTLVTTDLHNLSMPFIRYDSQDLVTLHAGNSACGRQHLAFSNIDGRTSDILSTPDGQLLIVLHFADYFDKFVSVEHFQVVQGAADALTIRLVVNHLFSAEEEARIRDYWTDYTRGTLSIEFEYVDRIEATSTGKRRLMLRSPELPSPV